MMLLLLSRFIFHNDIFTKLHLFLYHRMYRKLTRLPGNKKCADCSAKLPQVANLTFGTFVCLSCGGVHREFNHRIKGVGHSAFTQEEASFLQANGNDNVNAMYLANFSNGNENLRAPDGAAGTVDGQLLRVWLRRKYVDRAWAANNRNAASNIQPTRAQIPPKKQAAAPPAPSNDLLGGGDLFGAAPQPPAPAAAAPVPSYGNDADWDAFGKSRANANSFQADFGSQPQSNNNAQPSFQADFSPMPSQPPPQTPAPIPSFQPNFPSPDPPQQQHQQASFNPNFPQPSTPTRSQPAPAFEANFQHQPLPGAAMSAPPVSNDPPMQNGFNADFGNFPTSPTNHAQQNVQQPQMFQPQQQMQMQQPPQQEQNMQQQGFNPAFEQQQMQMQQQQQGFNPAFEQPQQQMQQPPQQQQQGFNHNFQQQQTQMQQPPQQNMRQQGYNTNFQQQPQQQMQQPPQQQQNMQQQGYNPNFQQQPQQQMQMHQQGFNPNFHQQMQMQQPTQQPQQNMQQQGFNPSFQQQQQMQMQQPPTQQTQMELPAPEQRANNTPPTIQTQPGPVADGMSMSIPSPIGANTSAHMPTTESGSNLNDDALPNTSENQASPVPEPVQVKEESADPFDAFNSLSIGDAPPMMNSLHSQASMNGMNGMGAPSTQEVKQEESIVQPPVQHITHEVGKKFLYRDSKNNESVVEILKVHRDDELVPYYEIKLPCGKEKQTDNAHLSEPPSNEELLKNIHEAIGGFDTAKLFAINQFIKSL